MGVDFMRPIFNHEPKYRVTIFTREDWTNGTGAPTAVKGLVWFLGSVKGEVGAGAGVYGQSVRRRLSFSLGRYAILFHLSMLSFLVFMKFNFRIDQRNT